ncbi:MAG: Alpha-L-rhamnosidase [Anaerocolumna sp.]|jgi:alpha-L-rhamnosidase|nr:Alpha-L-rhamnosidase [Anaerocolumna sp.]
MLKISTIKIEGLTENCITDRRPNIAFSLESDRNGETLERAEITVGNWKIETTDQLNNLYGGELKPFTTYDVYVTAIGKSGEIAKASSVFVTGRLNTPWKANWITDASYTYEDKASPIPMTFKYKFQVAKKIKKAWIHSTALGVYELLLNGEKVGNDYFSPGFTSYEHQIQYQTYDVTRQLKETNQILAVVAGGWAAGSFNYRRKSKISADRQALLCEIMIEYIDGTKDVLGTNRDWQVTEDGNYCMAEWYDGETYDASVDLESVIWKQADITKPRSNPTLLAQYGPPVSIQEILQPVSYTKAPSGEIIYDFGQNFAGVIHASIQGKRGQTIVFRHAEVLIHGELFVKSLRTAKATATYLCKDGKQQYSPKLTYMGFRYVGVKGIEPNDLELSALVLHSDIPETGYFECSNQEINKLQSNIRWGGKSNFVDIPTDCPQRDERQGWTGDFSVFASTACFNFDMSRFIDKWLMDMRSEQGIGGGFPMVIPKGGDSWPAMANSCWGDACILVPWAEYLARGDKGLLERQFPAIQKFLKAAKRWSAFLSITPNSRYIWRFPFHFGDWCAPDENIKQWLAKGKWVGTAYFANSCFIASKIAEILGKDLDASYYNNLRLKIIKAYRKAFTDGDGTLKKEFQTAYVLPLYFQMTKDTETKKMAENLVRLVRKADNHLTTGFTGTPYLLFALSDYGFVDVAYDLLLQESCPSWLYEVKAGATTIWERWDALRPDGSVNIGDLSGSKPEEESSGGMVSFNHYANGAVGDWLYRRIAGIEAISGGYKNFRIAPVIGGGLTFAKASVLTPYGKILSDWKIEADTFMIDVEIPVSTECTLILPNSKKYVLSSGRYQFSCKID